MRGTVNIRIWDGDIVTKSSLDTIVLKTTRYFANNTKKAHCTLQVVSVVLMKKLQDALGVKVTDIGNTTKLDRFL